MVTRTTVFAIRQKESQIGEVVWIGSEEEGVLVVQVGHVLEIGDFETAFLILHQFIEKELHCPHEENQNQRHRDLTTECASLSHLGIGEFQIQYGAAGLNLLGV